MTMLHLFTVASACTPPENVVAPSRDLHDAAATDRTVYTSAVVTGERNHDASPRTLCPRRASSPTPTTVVLATTSLANRRDAELASGRRPFGRRTASPALLCFKVEEGLKRK